MHRFQVGPSDDLIYFYNVHTRYVLTPMRQKLRYNSKHRSQFVNVLWGVYRTGP